MNHETTGDGGSPASGGSAGSGGDEGSGGDPGTGGATAIGGNQGAAGLSDDGGASKDGGSAMPEAAPMNYGPCSVAVSVTIASDKGGYDPENMGVIWVADGAKKWVKTVAIWAQDRSENLEAWVDATSAVGENGNQVDAVSSATSSSYEQHSATWDCTDAKHQVVPDGPYTLEFEMTDGNTPGPRDTIAFTKGAMPLMLTDDKPNFKAVTVTFTP